jgi:hypothetical protein
MEPFTASVEERYVWDCPYCGEMCEDFYDDPEEAGEVTCEHCGKSAYCESTQR